MKHFCLASLSLLWTLCTSGAMPLVGQESTTVETLLPDAQPRLVSYTTAIANIESAIRYELAAKDIPAFSIAIVDQSQLIWSAGFGFQDAGKETPASANTIYRVGSVSKLFTDIAVMQLAEDGALSIDTPIQELLPEFQPHNPFGQEITLKSLMSHLSGLVRESPVGNYFDPSEPSLSQTVESLNETQLVYPPHSRVKYSNAAVSVVGRTLESLIEDSHPEYVRRKILDPLHMTESGFEVTPEMRSDLATGWMRTYDQRRFEAPEFLLGTGPAGNL
ncbi:MAG: beta-lactamase family protein, partial [bacterium]|nr:beta-lactamase family protein [bacterium]